MKDYIIWLKSGECIAGIAKEETIKLIQNKFKDSSGKVEKLSFEDENGLVVVNINRIDAIAINDCCKYNQVGFIKS